MYLWLTKINSSKSSKTQFGFGVSLLKKLSSMKVLQIWISYNHIIYFMSYVGNFSKNTFDEYIWISALLYTCEERKKMDLGKGVPFYLGIPFIKGVAGKVELEQCQVAEPQQMEDLQQEDLLYIVSMEAGIPRSPWWSKNHEGGWLIVFGILLQICLLKNRGVQAREAETNQAVQLLSNFWSRNPCKNQDFP